MSRAVAGVVVATLSATFVASGVTKLLSATSGGGIDLSKTLLHELAWAPIGIRAISGTVALLELSVAVALCLPRIRSVAARLAEALLHAFTLWLTLFQHAGLSARDCGCFGDVFVLSFADHYLLNTGLWALAVHIRQLPGATSDVPARGGRRGPLDLLNRPPAAGEAATTAGVRA